jgi:ATP-dependent RNA helicase RhlE
MTSTSFSTLGLAEPILRAVSAEGYTNPTPIQAQAIPAVLEGHDLLGIAQTGTGKTAAFVLPMLNRLPVDRTPVKPRTCRMLVVAPTRELAAQIAEAARVYGRHLNPSIAVVVGGVSPRPQLRSLSRGVDILVATPGRLLDHIGTGAVRLTDTQIVVLDEADQMLDLGFVPQIRRIMAALPKVRQTMLFSATMPAPIRKLASDFLHTPVEIRVTPAATPVEAIDQRVVMVETRDKRAMLARLLGEQGVKRAIVFTRTKHGADKVMRHLDNAGISAAAIHGNKSQSQRERALDGFRVGTTRVLVATDIAARGIDVDGITHVVNYELPNVPESYVHRIGRTARAGADGIAVAFCAPEERPFLRDIERLIGRALPKEGSNGTVVAAEPEPEDRRPQPRAPRRRGANPGRPEGKPKGNGQHRSHPRSNDKPVHAQANGKPEHARSNGKPAHARSNGKADHGRSNGHELHRHSPRPHGNQSSSGDRPLTRRDHRHEARPGDEAEDAGLARMLGATRAA